MDGVKRAELSKPVALSVNEKAVISDNGLMLELSAINDSRCPVTANCIWAGNAVVKLSISGTGLEKTNLDFCLGQCDQRFQESDTVLFEQNSQHYSLILNKVDSYPGTADVTKTAIFIIKKN